MQGAEGDPGRPRGAACGRDLKTPPSRAELRDLLRRMDMTPRQLLRRRGTPYAELGLDDPAKTDAALVDAILAHPILMERPVVVGPRGVRLCRPPGRVQEVLPPAR
jgi:arsenate reductase (glutaredoxin)